MRIYKIDGMGYDSNIYIIPGRKNTIVDTGTGLNMKETLYGIKSYLDPEDIDQIVLTHEHFDHIGGANKLKELSDAKIIAHRDAVDTLKSGKSSFAKLLGAEMPKIELDVIVVDGNKLVLGDEEFEVVHTPGHSKGSICLYNEENGVLFSGDTVFTYGDFGRYDFPGGDFNQLVKSIKRLANLNVRNLYPGHGEHILKDGKNHILMALQNLKMI